MAVDVLRERLRRRLALLRLLPKRPERDAIQIPAQAAAQAFWRRPPEAADAVGRNSLRRAIAAE